MVKLTSKDIISDEVQQGLHAIAEADMVTYQTFVEYRIFGIGNVCDNMTKVKQSTCKWEYAAKSLN